MGLNLTLDERFSVFQHVIALRIFFLNKLSTSANIFWINTNSEKMKKSQIIFGFLFLLKISSSVCFNDRDSILNIAIIGAGFFTIHIAICYAFFRIERMYLSK